ncbi:uncharacterized protein [Watersipora subatra]|uniref:uncharacterized protein n=1 Tax=Watersipora subatra TaxID=2589382 RepID=UPI00355C805F
MASTVIGKKVDGSVTFLMLSSAWLTALSDDSAASTLQADMIGQNIQFYLAIYLCIAFFIGLTGNAVIILVNTFSKILHTIPNVYKKPHTIGETLVKPCLLECTKIILRDTAAQKIADLSLSDSTVKSRIDDTSADIKRQVIEKNKSSPMFTIQLAADVMNLVSDFFSKEHLDLGNLIGVYTDGAPAMLGCRAGFAQLVKEKNPLVVKSFHQCLAYLVDIFGSINEVNTKMQVDKKAPSDSLLIDIKHHLNSLIAEFERYFPKLDPMTEQLMSLTRDPVRRNVHEIPEQLQEEFLELTNNYALKDDFKELSI